MRGRDHGADQVSSCRFAIVLLAALILTGCRAQNRSQEQRYELVGTIVSVEANIHQVTVNHRAIPGYMEAMTMAFIVKDEAVLAQLKPGDDIKAELIVNRTEGRAWLQHVQITKRSSP